MDEIQEKIVRALKSNKECLSNANKLKNVLADVIPNDKMHINLVTFAYDEGVFKCFFESDPTLGLIQFVPKMVNNYGVTEDNAVWSIVTWCYVFSRKEIANALLCLNIQGNTASNNTNQEKQTETTGVPKMGVISVGMYKAGVDFPVGTVRVKIEYDPPKGEKDDGYQIWCGTGKKTNEIKENQCIQYQSYIEVKAGEYVSFHNIGSYPIKQMTYEKVD